MKTKFLFINLIAFFGLSMSALGQNIERNVIASSGSSGSGANISIDYTIGESLVQTYTGGSNILTQGFHQPASGTVSIEEVTEVIGSRVFPNPFTDVVQLELEINQSATVELKLTDVTGRLLNVVSAIDFNQGRQILSLSTANLASGSYVLGATVTSEGKLPVYLSKKIQLIR